MAIDAKNDSNMVGGINPPYKLDIHHRSAWKNIPTLHELVGNRAVFEVFSYTHEPWLKAPATVSEGRMMI